MQRGLAVPSLSAVENPHIILQLAFCIHGFNLPQNKNIIFDSKLEMYGWAESMAENEKTLLLIQGSLNLQM